LVPVGQNWIDHLSIARPTLINGVPLLFSRLYKQWGNEPRRTPGSLAESMGGRIRQLASGGAPLDIGLREAFKSHDLPIHQGYGLTEAGPVVCSNRSRWSSLGESMSGVGPLIRSVEARIEDATQRLWVRGPGLMSGYCAQEGDSLDSSTRRPFEWLDSGDRAELSPDGTLRILGRCDYTIVLSNGYKIQPEEIEEIVNRHTGVNDSAVIPISPTMLRLVLEPIDETKASSVELEMKIRQSLERVSGSAEIQLVWDQAAWTNENGLRNYKGAKNRAELHKRFCP
jgi:long-chain acyl-CoA synthetase